MAVARWLVAVVLAGCVQPGTITCGDFVCASGTQCMHVPSGGPPRCVTPEQVAACNDHMPLEECADGARCYELEEATACLAAGCGNGFTDPEEQCDDMNNRSLDGCSADCRSNETCGNGVIDPLKGEQCDDGNHLSHDGCASGCRIETAAWVAVGTDNPLPYTGPSIAYDTRRARLVMTGGVFFPQVSGGNPTPNLETWEWDGHAWSTYASPVSPLPRDNAAMAYDAARGVVVLFGGDGDLADTWEWNGAAWHQRDELGPQGRSYAAMAYDPRRHVTVLVGGVNGSQPLDQTTWEWDGTAWTGRDAGSLPNTSARPALAYDPKRGVMVLMLFVAGPTSTTEVYERTDAAWQHITSSPAGIANVTFDPVSEKMLALDERNNAWSYDGATLTQLVASAPLAGSPPRLATDAVHRKAIGFISEPFGFSNTVGVIEWNGASWKTQPAADPQQPVPGAGAAAASDTRRRLGLVFGGDLLGDNTWTFDGRAWTLAATVGPGTRSDHGLAYRSSSGHSLLFGGISDTQIRGDTWDWDGAMWRQLAITGPSARRGVAMAYDAARDRIVLFGGSTDATARLESLSTCACTDGATWSFDGTAWSSTPADATTPLARRDASLAYDPIRRELVMFGGWRTDGLVDYANDLWTYDGTWHEQHPATSPPARAAASFAWDASRQRLVLFGGYTVIHRQIGPADLHQNNALDDSWEWDGQRWRRLVPSTVPQRRGGHVAMTSPDGAGTIVLGGAFDLNGSLVRVDELTHSIRWIGDASEESCVSRVDGDGDTLAGCADPDCWPACTPQCPPGTTCSAGPRCGDGTCDPLESKLICPDDCGAATTSCGDLVCEMGETCGGDCP